MNQHVARTLLTTTLDVENSEEKVDEGVVWAGRRLRMRKTPVNFDTEEQREDRILKDLGLLEEGMSLEQKKELLLVVAASEKSATMEEKSRQISNNLDCNSDFIPVIFSVDQTASGSPKAKPVIDVENEKSSTPMSPCLFNDSCHSSPKVVSESPDIFENALRSPKRHSKIELDETLKKTKSVNEESPSSSIPILDSVKRTYDRKQIDPLDFIEDVQSAKLTDKRLLVIKDNSYWSCCCPDGIRPKDFAKSLRQKFETYHTDLHALQRRSFNFLKWGAPVVVGRHCSDTLDVWSSRRGVKLLEDPEEVDREENEITGSGSEGEFESLSKKDDSTKRKFNFKSKFRTYGRRVEETPLDSRQSVYNFVGSSDEDDPLKDYVQTSKFQDQFCAPKIKSSSEDCAEKDGDEYVPGSQPAKKKHKPLRLGMGKTRPRVHAHVPHVLGEKSFYGKPSNQLFDIHHVTSEETRPRNAGPKPSTNLQDVLKPNLKINVNKVGIGKKWQRKEDCAVQLLASADKANGSGDEVEIVDTFSKRATNASKKLKTLARSGQPSDKSDSVVMGKNSSKRLRLANLLESENEELVELDIAKRAPSTSHQLFSPEVSVPKVLDVQTRNDDVPCPLCCKKFALSAIEEHASDCQGEEQEPSWNTTRTPKNRHRCYICQRVFDPASYKDHVVVCVARMRTMPVEMPEEPTTPDVRAVDTEILQKENCGRSLLSRLNTPKIGATCSAKTFNCISGESPLGNTRLLHPSSIPFNHIDEGDFSMAHVSTPTFQMFKPISQLKDSPVDFKNQFPVACQGKKRRTAKSVKTKKRKKSFKAKKSPRGRKSK